MHEEPEKNDNHPAVVPQNHSIVDSAQLFDAPIDEKKIETAARNMLEAFGEDPERQGLARTPERIARMYSELLSGYRTDPVAMVNDAIFEVDYDEMVIVRDIEF